MSSDSRHGLPRAVVFDHDGVIVDSITADYAACAQVFQEYGAALPAQHWARAVCGRTDGYPALFTGLAARTGDPGAAEAMQRRLERLWEENLRPETVPLVPGLVALLDRLREAGVRVAVASAAPRRWVERCLDQHGLRGRFEVLVGGDDVELRKPAPDAYLEAVRRLGLPAASCAAVEDSLTGVHAARAAGLRVVAVPTALTRTLDYSAADLVVAGHPDISTELLGRLFDEGHRVAD